MNLLAHADEGPLMHLSLSLISPHYEVYSSCDDPFSIALFLIKFPAELEPIVAHLRRTYRQATIHTPFHTYEQHRILDPWSHACF